MTDLEDDPILRAKARIGQTLRGRWHLESLLGIGGMAAVYAATHRNGKRVALKILHPELSTHPEVRRRFLDEGYAANRLVHPAAVSVLDDEMSDDGEVFLVMDRLDGETLEDRITRDGPLSQSEVVFIADILLDVLAAAHDLGIVHRDVKPDNVFLTSDGKVKLLDFGIARVSSPGRKRTTLAGAPLGTPCFMPPEQALGHLERIDGRTDLWAVGATMFTALTGKQVHDGGTANEDLLLAMTRQAPSLADAAPRVSRDLARVVDCALAFDQEARWPNASAMQLAVRAVAVLVGTTPPPHPTAAVENRPAVESRPPVVHSMHEQAKVAQSRAPRKSRAPRAMAWAAYGAAVVLGAAAALALVARSASTSASERSGAVASQEERALPSHFRISEADAPTAAANLEEPSGVGLEVGSEEFLTVTKSPPLEGRPRPLRTQADPPSESRVLAAEAERTRAPGASTSSDTRLDPLARRK